MDCLIEKIGNIISNPFISQLLGLVAGLFTSFFSWWVLFRFMVPIITTSDAISKTKSTVALEEDDDKTGFRYRIKLENSGYRPIIDLELRAFVRIKGLKNPHSDTWEVAHLPMNLNGDKIYSTPLMNPVRKSKIRTLLRIYPNHTDYFTRPHFPAHIREKSREKKLLLEDLLSLGSSANLRIAISGVDGLTGARKVFIKNYRLQDIKLSEFTKYSTAIRGIERLPPFM